MSMEPIQLNFRKILLLAVVATYLLIADVSPASATFCVRVLSIAEAFSSAESVFSGKVIDDQKNPEYTFQVSKVWKGRSSRYITVTLIPMFTYLLGKGESYLIFAYKRKGRLTIWREPCAPSLIPINRAKDYLTILGVGKDPPLDPLIMLHMILKKPYKIFALAYDFWIERTTALIRLYSR